MSFGENFVHTRRIWHEHKATFPSEGSNGRLDGAVAGTHVADETFRLLVPYLPLPPCDRDAKSTGGASTNNTRVLRLPELPKA